MLAVRKSIFKNMEIHSVLGLFPPFPGDVLEGVRKDRFKICFAARNLNVGQKSITLQAKFFPHDFNSIVTLSFHKMFTGK